MEGKQVPHGTGRARGRARGGSSSAQPGPGGPPPPGPQGPPPPGMSGPSGAARGPPPPGPSAGPGAGDARGQISQQPPGGKGRADRRGGMTQGPSDEPTQRPGPESFGSAPPPSAQQGPGFEEGVQGHAQGRAVHRGPGAMRPGQDVHAVTAQMGGMSMGGGGPRGEGLAGRRRGALSVQYLEQSYRPQTLDDKKGQSGRQCQIFANVFGISETVAGGIATVYQYHVDFAPEVPSQRIRKSMINSLKPLIGDVSITDGMLLFLPVRLENEMTETVVTRITDNATIKVTIKFSNAVERGSNTCLQIFNLLYKRMLQHIGLTMIQRNYFNPRLSVQVPQHRLEIWPGYATAIGLYERNIGLAVDVSHKIMSTQTVYDVITDISRNVPNPDNQKQAIVRALVGKIVLTRYNNKTYRIDDVDFSRRPADTFERRDKSQQSFVEYYKNAYQATINDLNQPLLISMPSKKDQRAGQQGPICLIPELCTVTGLPEEMLTDQRRMRDIAKHTRIGPGERVQQLRNLANQINDNPAAKKEFANWNIALSRDIVSIHGRVLQRENVKMAPGTALGFDELKADWSREMRSQRLVSPISLEPGSWIFICPGMLNQLAGQVVQTLQQVGRQMGMQIAQPQAVSINDANAVSYLSGLKSNINKNTKMVVILLRNQRKDVYDALKTYLCLENPVPSQCLVEKTVRDDKKRMSVITKVAIQMNCKMGGEIWALDIPLNNTMVIGIDTYHDSQKKHRSAVGMVASLNKTLTRYYTKCFLQSENEELGRGLNASMQACLRKYHEVNGVLPERIFLFRDGVGDGMIPMVKSYEIEQLVKCFDGVGANYKPKLTVIVVKKRMTTRLFMRDEQGFGNPPPGTVVDDCVTKPMWYDYYIVSQSVNQGTVAPTHYNIIHHDNDNLKPEHLQRLSYKLCHLYYNWPGTIRVPAPCQYAHKVAFLVGQSLHREPHSSLCDKLFYL